MKIMEAVDKFIVDQQLRGNTDMTVNGYRGYLRRFAEYLAVDGITELPYLTVDHIHNYQLFINRKPCERGRNEKLTKRSVQTYIRHIKVFAGYCFERKYILSDMRTEIRIPKAERLMIQVLTDTEVDSILYCFDKSVMGVRDTALICLMLDCGLRLEEVTRIKSDDINFEKGYIMVMGKGRRGRIVPMGKTVSRLINDYLQARKRAANPADDKYIFLTRDRQPIKKSTLAQLMKRLKQKTGINRLHAHLLRHTFATNYLLHGLGDVYELSRLLGHSDIKITEWYLQLASYYAIMERRERVTYLDKVRNK